MKVEQHSDRRLLTIPIAALLGTAIVFRLMSLASVPGVSGDEGWWGRQALAWLSGQPYEAHTTSGNPTDLFHLIPLALLHAIAPPSFLLLRLLPALVNLLALPVGFLFVRRLYGSTTAWAYTVALAILPTAIAHSRICQDPSQTIFWTGIVIYLALLGFKEHSRAWIYLAAAVLTFPIALWTHPTNIFIAPFLVLPFAAAVRPLLPTSMRGRVVLFYTTTLLTAVGTYFAWTAFRELAGSNEFLNQPWLEMASARMTDGAQWFEFAANNARLFNGVTVYHYFSGARPATLPYDAAFVLVVLALLLGFLVTPAAGRSPVDYGLIGACVLTWLGFYAFAGPDALRPHFERWGLCLIVPGTLVLTRGLSAWIDGRPRMRQVTIGAAALVATSLLVSFYVNYFGEFATTGGRSHRAYTTAATEPKQRALEYILEKSPGPDRVTIVAQEWWLFWPIAYLASKHSNVSVSRNLTIEAQAGVQEALDRGRVFFVEFAGTSELAKTIEWIGERGWRTAGTTTVQDAGGRALLQILQVTAR